MTTGVNTTDKLGLVTLGKVRHKLTQTNLPIR